MKETIVLPQPAGCRLARPTYVHSRGDLGIRYVKEEFVSFVKMCTDTSSEYSEALCKKESSKQDPTNFDTSWV